MYKRPVKRGYYERSNHESFAFVDNVNKYGMSLYDMFDKVITIHKHVAKLLSCDEKVIMSIMLNDCNLPLRTLFDFEAWPCVNTHVPPHYFLAVRKGLTLVHRRNLSEIDYDIYIRENPYLGLQIPQVISIYLRRHFPHIFNHPRFNTQTQRFDKRMFELVKPHTKLSVLAHQDWAQNLTLQDIADFVTDGEICMEDTITESIFNIYYNSIEVDPNQFLIFLPCQNDKECDKNSLYIPLSAIINNDWSIIENKRRTVFASNGAWDFVKQKDLPIINTPNAQLLKELLTTIR